jgi:glycosyltransferase involved in cell wall biosynthesis
VSDARAPRVLVNSSFRPQRVTGQQRYAIEIADRLLTRPGFEPIGPSGRWSGSSLRVWAWVLLALNRAARGATLLSLTARAPIRHRRHVVVVHDLFLLTNPEWFSRRFSVTHAPLLRAHLREAAAIVAVSEPVAAEVRERFSGEVVVAPNAPSSVFGRADAAADATVLQARGLESGDYLLSVGSMDPRKNLPALAEAYGRLPLETRQAMPLVIVGGGAAAFRDQSFTWPEGTRDAGYVSDDELRALYAGARAVVFPSKAEGFGLPLVEAAAAHCAGLVVSDIPVFRWICGDGAVYVDPDSAASIAAGLQRAIDGTVPPISIAPDRFDWDSSAETVGELCLRVAKGDA